MKLTFTTILSAIVLFTGTSLAAEINLRLAHVMSPNEPAHKAAVAFAKAVEEKTKGRVGITVHPSGQLGTNPEIYEQVKIGAPIIQIADPGYLSDFAPDFGVLNGPYLLEDPRKFEKILSSPVFADMRYALRERGNFEVLSMNWFFGARHIIAKGPVITPAQAKDLAIRVPPNVMWIETMKAIGANGVQIAWSEVYPGLSTGVVEAAEAPLASLLGAKLYEAADHVSMTGHFKAFIGPVMNAGLFASYPADIQKILLDEATAAGVMMTRLVLESEDKFRQQLEAQGVTVHTDVDVAQFRDATRSVYDQFPDWSAGLHQKVQEALNK